MIVLPKIGAVYYRTSKEYKRLLNSDEIKINNVTIKKHNGKYYAVFKWKSMPNENVTVVLGDSNQTLKTNSEGIIELESGDGASYSATLIFEGNNQYPGKEVVREFVVNDAIGI